MNNISKIHNNKQFSIITWNIENLLQLYDFIDFDDGTVLAKENKVKMNNFLKIFEQTDVACLQEVSIPNNIDKLADLHKVSEFKNQPIVWLSSLAIHSLYKINNTVPFLGNSIYSNKKLINLDELHNNLGEIISDSDSGLDNFNEMRSVVFYTLNNDIKIASTHLSGGRFDDQIIANNILSNNYKINPKLSQIKKIIQHQPDIICGDFNTKYFNPNQQLVINSTNNYKNLLFKDKILSEYQEQQWDNWIWDTQLDLELKKSGYQSVYENKKITFDTTSYGGCVDMIYYKPDKLDLVFEPEIINNPVVMEKETDITNPNIYKPVLSDHFPVKAVFRLK